MSNELERLRGEFVRILDLLKQLQDEAKVTDAELAKLIELRKSL